MRKCISTTVWNTIEGGMRSCLCLLSMYFLFGFTDADAQQIQASVDTAHIQIGEQVIYKIAVDSDESELVVFPEGQTFSPLEVVESFPTDTVQVEERFELIKKYSLTQWDSGSYRIPRQKILINNSPYFTDSLLLKVSSVAVDTTKQQMFPIKSSVDVPPGFSVPGWAWWILVVVVLATLGIYLYFRRRKKKAEAASKLPPYDQAIYELQQLDRSTFLEQRELKEYYSQLSAAVRRYLDGEVYDHAMESTTGELILYLENERSGGRLNLSDQTIDQLGTILQRADLAKFANSRPDVITAKEDRRNAEYIINDTKAAIPEPSEQELQRDKEYEARVRRKKKLKKILPGIVVLVVLFSGTIAYFLSTQGTGYVANIILGSKSKDLLEGEWIRSEYGTPPVAVTTPEVLKRVMNDSLARAGGKESFRAGSINSPLLVALSTRPAGQGFRLQNAVEEVLSYLEEKGAQNIITKQETITTLKGVEGLKIFGTMGMKVGEKTLEKNYVILNFVETGGYQQIVVIYNADDEYAQEIAQRIADSVELTNAES